MVVGLVSFFHILFVRHVWRWLEATRVMGCITRKLRTILHSGLQGGLLHIPREVHLPIRVKQIRPWVMPRWKSEPGILGTPRRRECVRGSRACTSHAAALGFPQSIALPTTKCPGLSIYKYELSRRLESPKSRHQEVCYLMRASSPPHTTSTPDLSGVFQLNSPSKLLPRNLLTGVVNVTVLGRCISHGRGYL